MDEPVPAGRTARRLEWSFLPPAIRDLIERWCGSPVVRADSQGAGFTPGFASVLRCADGSRHFVKAASVRAQRQIAESYREEARKLAALPRGVPAPRLRWHQDADDWVVLGIEHVAGRNPSRPWRADELGAVLDTLERLAADLTPVPAGLALEPVTADLDQHVGLWDAVRSVADRTHADEAAALAASYAEGARGETVVHTDVRDDNVLLDRRGRVWICDWNWPAAGAPWLDTLLTLVQPRGDGVDVEAIIAARPVFDGVPAEQVDAVLALLAGYFLHQGMQPSPPTSPYLRRHQRWCGEVTWDWLAERRGWRL